jgi:hypothetical protein
MSCKSLCPLTLLAAGLLVAACQDDIPTGPVEAQLGLEAVIAEAGATAVQSGDTDRAEALRQGASALRWGIRPSRIDVKIKNETYHYLAIVVGVVHRNADGERVLVRSLLAWTGRRPVALLQVTSASEQALFGQPDEGNGGGDGPGGARGHWKDLAHRELWVATAGSADLSLASTGRACPVQPHDAARQCVLASFDLRVNGIFQLSGNGGPGGQPIEIHTESDGVRGVVIKPAE